MFTYLIINLLIIIVPLLLSFESKLKFYKNWKYYLLSLSIVSAGYIVWDIYATIRGDWSFSAAHTLPFRFIGLPVEEILFFVTVPYSTLFIYETIQLYIKERKLDIPSWVFYSLAIMLAVAAVLFYGQYYTFTVLLFCAGFLILAEAKMKILIRSGNFWIVMLITYIPFFVVNYILTSIPIVSYSDKAIWGARISTIPVEDFFYSFSMISFWLYFYIYFKNKKK